jgi:hypothetical protein
MGVGVVYIAIIGLIILICSPIAYFILTKLGKKKLGIAVAIILASIVIIPLLCSSFEGTFYNKTDAKEDLRLANLKLDDDFEIISNNVSGMPERYQYTKLKLTEKDKNRIIAEIKNGKGFKESNETDLLYTEMWNEKSVRNKVIDTNYLFGDGYIRESYFREGEYVPIHITVSLSADSDTLDLERIEK